MATKKKEEVEATGDVPATLEASKALVPIREKELALAEQTKDIARIRTNADRTLIATARASIKDLLKLIHDELDPIVASAHENWQMNLELRRKHTQPLERDDARLKKILDDDKAEQDRAAEKKRRELQAKADAKAKADRDAQVKALRESGQEDVAAVIEAAPVEAAPVVVTNKANAAAAAAGLTFKVTKHMEVVAPEEIDRKYLSVNEGAIQAAANAYWQEIKPADTKDEPAMLAAIAKFSEWKGVKGVRFWITRESADTGRRG